MRSLIEESQLNLSKVILQAILPKVVLPARQLYKLAAVLIFLMLALTALVLPSGYVLAQTQTSIGFVDIPYLIEKAPQALDAEQRLETEFGPRQLELKVQREELNDIKDRLDTEGLEMSDNERGQLDRQARGLERRLKRDEQDFREELNIQKNNEFKKVRILVLEAIARFGKSNDYDLIVSDGVLYANKSIDVTEKILADLVKSGQSLSSSN